MYNKTIKPYSTVNILCVHARYLSFWTISLFLARMDYRLTYLLDGNYRWKYIYIIKGTFHKLLFDISDRCLTFYGHYCAQGRLRVRSSSKDNEAARWKIIHPSDIPTPRFVLRWLRYVRLVLMRYVVHFNNVSLSLSLSLSLSTHTHTHTHTERERERVRERDS